MSHTVTRSEGVSGGSQKLQPAPAPATPAGWRYPCSCVICITPIETKVGETGTGASGLRLLTASMLRLSCMSYCLVPRGKSRLGSSWKLSTNAVAHSDMSSALSVEANVLPKNRSTDGKLEIA